MRNVTENLKKKASINDLWEFFGNLSNVVKMAAKSVKRIVEKFERAIAESSHRWYSIKKIFMKIL